MQEGREIFAWTSLLTFFPQEWSNGGGEGGHKMVNNRDTVDCFNRKKRTIERVVSRQNSVGMEKTQKIYIFMTRTMFGEQKFVNCRKY
jgi:hypothetical protein